MGMLCMSIEIDLKSVENTDSKIMNYDFQKNARVRNLPVRKVQGLGGKFGEKLCEDLGIENMGQLGKFSKEELQKRYDERNGYAIIILGQL